MCEHGCAALWNMTVNGKTSSVNKQNEITDENKVKAGAAGGIEAIVKAINTHICNAGVCENGCAALRNMTVNGKTSSVNRQNEITDENKVKAGRVGGIEAVVKAISTHINNAGVCELGCGALGSMAESCKIAGKTT